MNNNLNFNFNFLQLLFKILLAIIVEAKDWEWKTVRKHLEILNYFVDFQNNTFFPKNGSNLFTDIMFFIKLDFILITFIISKFLIIIVIIA